MKERERKREEERKKEEKEADFTHEFHPNALNGQE